MCVAYKKGHLYCITHINTNPFLGDDVSLCAYLVEHILSICFLQNNHNYDDQKTVVILVILCLSVLSAIM